MSILNGPVIEAVNSQNPKKIVIFCHGYGADGNDLISLANYFQPTLPDAVFLSPNAPEKCGMSPIGYQWFDLTKDNSVGPCITLFLNSDGKFLPVIFSTASIIDKFCFSTSLLCIRPNLI